MKILRKIKTALSVFRRQGFREVCRLGVKKAAFLLRYVLHCAAGGFYRLGFRKVFRMFRKNSKPRVLYVTSRFEAEGGGQTARYRIHNLIEALRGKAEAAFEVADSGIALDDCAIDRADVIVLMRLDWSEHTDGLIRRAKKWRKPLVFDIDDIIFLPEYINRFCQAIEDHSEETVRLYRETFLNFEKTFRQCDYATASTPFITQKMEQAGKRAFVIHNGLNDKQLGIASGLEFGGMAKRNVNYLAYLSGSKTHDRDFRQALPAVVRILREYPDLRLRIAGYLDLEGWPEDLIGRVDHAGYMKYTQLLKYSAENFINLAPLDTENPFCHAKSELKYFEAAIVGVPTVASPTDTFVRCIVSRENGLLASTEEEWYQSIKSLIDDEVLYQTIAENARKHALDNYSPPAIGRQAGEAYSRILQLYREECSESGR
ncbi:MAG TPA: glycosyltransferase family 4 protein [Clostridia bacterium]|nr:glycosyltransferase family 4 protein [Clostridia bacterium]